MGKSKFEKNYRLLISYGLVQNIVHNNVKNMPCVRLQIFQPSSFLMQDSSVVIVYRLIKKLGHLSCLKKFRDSPLKGLVLEKNYTINPLIFKWYGVVQTSNTKVEKSV